MAPSPLQITIIAPVESRLNPYAELLCRALKTAQPGISCHLQNWFGGRWFLSHWRHINILHLHWIEYLYLAETRNATYRKFVFLAAALAFAKTTGIKIVYTVHNVTPHRNRYPVLSNVANGLIFTLAHAIHVHDNHSRQELSRRYGRTRDVFVIPHGSYTPAYPNECTREQAREKLGLPPGNFTYLFLGQLRPNKGIEDLILAFRDLEGDDANLIIAGWAPEADYERQLRCAAGGDTRITIHSYFIPDYELQYFFKAGDSCVLPYKQVTTSGAALLAFSFGKPIIAPKLGCFAELVREGRGILYDPAEPDGLGRALKDGRKLDLSRAERETLALASSLDWPSIGQQHLSMYRHIAASG